MALARRAVAGASAAIALWARRRGSWVVQLVVALLAGLRRRLARTITLAWGLAYDPDVGSCSQPPPPPPPECGGAASKPRAASPLLSAGLAPALSAAKEEGTREQAATDSAPDEPPHAGFGACSGTEARAVAVCLCGGGGAAAPLELPWRETVLAQIESACNASLCSLRGTDDRRSVLHKLEQLVAGVLDRSRGYQAQSQAALELLRRGHSAAARDARQVLALDPAGAHSAADADGDGDVRRQAGWAVGGDGGPAAALREASAEATAVPAPGTPCSAGEGADASASREGHADTLKEHADTTVVAAARSPWLNESLPLSDDSDSDTDAGGPAIPMDMGS